jgi:hypothetical protein
MAIGINDLDFDEEEYDLNQGNDTATQNTDP